MTKLLKETTATPLAKTGNLWKAVCITPGKGSSGTYSEELLREYGSLAFPKGTHSYVDHPTSSEPGRSPKNLMGVLAEDAYYEEGVGVVANLEVFKHWKDFVEEVGPHTGLSIYAMGDSDLDGNVTMLEAAVDNSVDLVSYAGRGGALATKLYESAISHSEPKDSSEASEDVRKENQVDVKEMQDAIAESNKALIAELLEALKPAVPVADEVDYAAAAEAVVAEKLTPTARKNIFKALSEGAKLEDALGVEKAAAAEYKALYESENVEPVAGGRVVEGAGAAVYSMAGAVGIKVGV